MDMIEKRRLAKESLVSNLSMSVLEHEPTKAMVSWIISCLDNSRMGNDWTPCVSYWAEATEYELGLLSVLMGWIEPQARRPGETMPLALYESHCRLEQYVKNLIEKQI